MQVLSSTDPVSTTLAQLQPLRIERVDTPQQQARAFAALRAHRYLGFSCSVGENVGYLVFDSLDRLLAGLAAYGPTRGEEYRELPKWRRKAKRPSCQDLVTLLRQQFSKEKDPVGSPEQMILTAAA